MRSLCNKIEIFNQFLIDTNIDIACLTETWLNPSGKQIILSQINNNYTCISTERQDRMGGGTAIFINKKYSDKIEKIKLTTDYSFNLVPKQEIELTIARVYPKLLPRGYSSCLVICAYIPVWSKSEQRNASYQLAQLIEPAITRCTIGNKPLIFLAGDLNGCPTDFICRSHQLIHLNTHSTRKTSILDIILTNAPKCYVSNTLPSFSNSDHLVVVSQPPLNLYKSTRPVPHKVAYRSGRIADTVALIRSTNIEILVDSPYEIQVACNNFYHSILSAQDICQPLKSTTLVNPKPWMTQLIQGLIKERQQLFFSGYKEWKALANRISTLITKRKRIYNRRFTTGKTDFWREISLADKGKITTPISETLANQLNDHFQSVWTGNKQPSLSCFIDREANPPTTPIFTLNNIVNQLSKLKPGSSGPDDLSPFLLKSARFEIASSLCILFNRLIENSYLPDQWKSANITPIPKISNPQSSNDYRPISIASALCKVFERIITIFIVHHTKHIWVSNKQFSFLLGRSTMDATIQIIKDWSHAKDNNKSIYAIFFDFEKAFDLVSHDKLLLKLVNILPSWLTSWIAAYLSNRQQRIKTNDHTTDWKCIEAGVLQGSVLGPILFILFISDINVYLPPETILEKYADDILTYIINDKFPTNLPQSIVDGVALWSKVNGMKLNGPKCKIIRIIPRCSEIQALPSILLNNTELEIVSSHKYLGIMLNENVDWDEQWTKVHNKIKSIPYLLRRLKQIGHTQPNLLQVYRSYAISHLIYSAPILTSCSAAAKREIQHFHKNALQIIGIDVTNSSSFNIIFDIEELLDRICINTLKKILADPCHPITTKLTQTNSRNPNRFPYALNTAKTTTYQKTFIQKYLRILRDGVSDFYLPSNIGSSTTFSMHK
ncbi:uncharacterized protein LOC136074618 [Hydra vulgaris]|uniref:Uncharacterized protein LOC136074618 n=1 Tax=Hydra vulgaris TaxID=6087 RepID=A0ABM4B2K2_HYDVU